MVIKYTMNSATNIPPRPVALQIHIQRTEGCDHMTCTQCSTNFCYRCGERYRHLR